MEGKPCKDCHPKLLKDSIPQFKNVCIKCGVESPVKYKPRVKQNWECSVCRNTKEKSCPICNNKFITKWNSQTCSYKCMNILIAKNIGGPEVVNLSQIERIRKTRRFANGAQFSGEKNGMYGKNHTEDTKRKMRIKRTQRFLKTGLTPRVNLSACSAIDKLGYELGYKFQHGNNGGEFYIKQLGYYVDGYDQKNNVVVEYDELHHLQETRKIKDDVRQTEIIELLKCKFIRLVEQKDGTIQVKHIN
jgi:hypothetical protein